MKNDYTKRLNTLIIGAGQIASGYDSPNSELILTHAHAVNDNESFELVGFVDIDLEKAQFASQKWGGKPFGSIDEVQDRIDVVCCAVPDDYHYSAGTELIRLHPKACIIEKPFTAEVSDGYKLMDIMHSRNIPVEVNYSRRFIKEFIDIKAEIAPMGKLIAGTAYYGRGFKHNASHLINLLVYLFGEISPLYDFDGIADYSDKDHNRLVLYDVDGAIITFVPVDGRAVTVYEMDLLFENGRIEYNGTDSVIRTYGKGISHTYESEENYVLYSENKIDESQALINLYKNIYSIIYEGSSPVSSMEDAIKTLELCQKGRSNGTQQKNRGHY